MLFLLACQSPTAAQLPLSQPAAQGQPQVAGPDGVDQRTPAQQKISSQLLDAISSYREGMGPPPGGSGVDVDDDGKALVDIDAAVTDDLLNEIAALEGTVVSSFPQYEAIRARVPLHQLEVLAARTDVRFIRPADEAVTNRPGALSGAVGTPNG